MNRYLVRVKKPNCISFEDAEKVLKEIRKVLKEKGKDVKVGNLRVSTYAIEFDIFIMGIKESELANLLPKPYNEILTLRKLNESLNLSKKQVFILAKNLFNQERYWEVHEVLEEVWKKEKGNKKALLQGLILVASALVHYQRNEKEVGISMLKRALEKLNNSSYGKEYEFDIEKIRGEIKKIVREKKVKFFRI
ncbi:MAG: DUF309 domain-containing protein [Nitrososphaerales archaeon]